MKPSDKESRLDARATALLTDAGIISSITDGLRESFWNLPHQPHSIQVVDIIEQNGAIKIRYTYSLNGTEMLACRSVIAGIWLSIKGPLTSEQMKNSQNLWLAQ